MVEDNTRERLRKRGKALLRITMIVLFIISSIGCSTYIQGSSTVISTQANPNLQGNSQTLKVSYMDVGQADSILIQVPNGRNILIDAGNNEDAEMIVSYLKKQGIHRLDFVIGTHPHEDHIGSIDKVLQAFEIGQVLMPKVTTTTETFKEVIVAIQAKGLKITEPKAGLKLDLGSQDVAELGVSAEVIAPKLSRYEDMNDYSIVLRVDYGQNSFLFTGDAEEVSEKEMLALSGDTLKVDVLKVGHHGSASSTTQEFLKKVNPKYAVISVGAGNTYGHPSTTTLNRLKKYGVEIYRTDELGTIVAESDGTQIHWSYSK